MKHFLRLSDYTESTLRKIFSIAEEIEQGKYADCLKRKTAVMFFPNTSIRTRVTFEKGVSLLGGQTILFPTEALDKKEELEDVVGYLNNWADLIVVRHKDMRVLEKMASCASVPVVNAMSDETHPCEILSDLYAISKRKGDFTKDKFLFCGAKGNIGRTWQEASAVFGFSLEQCCGVGQEIGGMKVYHDVNTAIIGKDIICTDSLSAAAVSGFENCRVTKEALDLANRGAILNPCPPFYRGEEVSRDAIASEYFVGYAFKKDLLVIQQAVMVYCLMG